MSRKRARTTKEIYDEALEKCRGQLDFMHNTTRFVDTAGPFSAARSPLEYVPDVKDIPEDLKPPLEVRTCYWCFLPFEQQPMPCHTTVFLNNRLEHRSCCSPSCRQLYETDKLVWYDKTEHGLLWNMFTDGC